MYGVVYLDRLWGLMTSAEVTDTATLFVLGLVGALGLGVFALWPQR